jgi:hypothetical protein
VVVGSCVVVVVVVVGSSVVVLVVVVGSKVVVVVVVLVDVLVDVVVGQGPFQLFATTFPKESVTAIQYIPGPIPPDVYTELIFGVQRVLAKAAASLVKVKLILKAYPVPDPPVTLFAVTSTDCVGAFVHTTEAISKFRHPH